VNPARTALLSSVVALLLSGVPTATLAGPTIHWGQYATVQSDTDGNGLYTYSLTAGTDPLTFIAGQDHILELTFYGMEQINDTPDWESSSPAADLICWTYTGADPLTLGDTPIVFSAQSSVNESHVWPVATGNPSAPYGLVAGETESGGPYGLDAFQYQFDDANHVEKRIDGEQVEPVDLHVAPGRERAGDIDTAGPPPG
jgi:hypothetical protein